jgi:hypothetical protein
MNDKYILFSNKNPYEQEFNSLSDMKKWIKDRAKYNEITEKNTSIVRFIKFEDGHTFYYIKKRNK